MATLNQPTRSGSNCMDWNEAKLAAVRKKERKRERERERERDRERERRRPTACLKVRRREAGPHIGGLGNISLNLWSPLRSARCLDMHCPAAACK
jgi:hypothetical protein